LPKNRKIARNMVSSDSGGGRIGRSKKNTGADRQSGTKSYRVWRHREGFSPMATPKTNSI